MTLILLHNYTFKISLQYLYFVFRSDAIEEASIAMKKFAEEVSVV